MKLFLTLILLALPSMAAAQTPTPCDAVNIPPGVFFNPDKIFVKLTEHTTMEADGVTPRVTDYQIGYWAQGVNPGSGAAAVVGPTVMVKTAFTLAPGSVDCYTASLADPVPVGGPPLVAAMRARRAATATIPAALSNWSVVGNPFAVAPTVLIAPGPPTTKK